MAYAAILVDDHRLAVELLERALPAAGEAEDPTTLPHCLSNLALAHLIAGRLADAEEWAIRWLEKLDQADLERADRKQEGYPLSETMDVLAAIAACRGDLKHAARLSGVAIRLRPTGLAPRDADERLRREFLDPARQALTPRRWERLEQEGTRLSIERAIELAIDAD